MRIFVISLKTQVERREAIRNQLDALGIEFSFFDAVDMRNSKTKYFRAVDVKKFHLNAGRNPLTNEIGCYASHLTLWRTCIALDEPIVILEDDAKLSEQFESALPFLDAQVGRLGFIRLEANPYESSVTVARSGQYSASYCTRYPFSAMAYAISPQTARAFIDASDTVLAPVDKFIKDFWGHQQPLHRLIPHVAEESELGIATTTIGARHKPTRRRLGPRIERLNYKAACYLRRLRFNLRHRLRLQASGPRIMAQNSQRMPVAGSNGNQ